VKTVSEENIKEKINRMISETGEHPFVFRIDDRPVFVSFPVEAYDYFSPQELTSAEQIIMQLSGAEQAAKSEPSKEQSLIQRLSEARKVSETAIQDSQYQPPHKAKDIHI